MAGSVYLHDIPTTLRIPVALWNTCAVWWIVWSPHQNIQPLWAIEGLPQNPNSKTNSKTENWNGYPNQRFGQLWPIEFAAILPTDWLFSWPMLPQNWPDTKQKEQTTTASLTLMAIGTLKRWWNMRYDQHYLYFLFVFLCVFLLSIGIV